MKAEHVESLEELVFKNKNKLYGAFLLRRKYNKHLAVSLLFGLFVIFSAISYPLVAAYLSKDHLRRIGPSTGDYVPFDPTPDQPPPPPPPPAPEPLAPERIRFVAPVVVDKDIETNLASQDDLKNQPSSPLSPDVIDVAPVDNTKNIIEQPVAPPAPWISVEEMPQFPGGEAELFRFLRENIKYPQEAREVGVSGRVFIYFVVEPDGSISGISVKRGIGSGCDEEALRVVGLMPKWIPGKQAGVPVRVQFTLPVKFTLQ
jgi:periplasmic protein TonB